jgi:uncharacterized membrane protein
VVMAGGMLGIEAWIWMGAWALVMVLAVALLVREPRRDVREDPAAVLRDRFARGEITEDEYRRATAALGIDRLHAPDDAHPPVHR